jgi:cytochrome b involved in lipid metabolism
MNKRSTDAWVAWAIRNKRSIFFYDAKVLDLTDFASVHPGGKRSLESYIYKDITQTLFKVYPHNREKTLHRLSQFIIGFAEI